MRDRIRKIKDGTASLEAEDEFEQEYYAPQVLENWLYGNRNYNVFSILGNVRNGYGFAGISTGSGFNYISSERGLPEDVSDEIQKQFDGDRYHSVSHVTLTELLDFDWDQTTTKEGVVDAEQYDVFLRKGRPEYWSGGVSGGGVINVSNEEMTELLQSSNPIPNNKSYYTKVQWEQTYRESVQDFLEEALPELQNASETTDGSDVRIIFGFDS